MNAMTVAIAKAAKKHNQSLAAVQQPEENIPVTLAVEKDGVNSVTTLPPVSTSSVGKKQKPLQLFKVEEIAEAVGCSLSYVYLMISRLKPEPMAREGKSALYSEAFLKQMKELPRRKRNVNVRVLPQKQLITEAKTITPEAITVESVADKQQQEKKQGSLLERIDTLEKQMAELRQLLGA